MNSEFIKKIVNHHQVDENRYSVIVTALQDARLISGLYKQTADFKRSLLLDIQGEYVMHTSIALLGLINYLIILDMLGSIFKKTNFRSKTPPNENSITYLLEQFAVADEVSEADRDTIKALRNCLAHNYSLLSIPLDEKKDKNELHAFSIC